MTFERDEKGRIIVDDLIHEPHYPTSLLARIGEEYFLLSGNYKNPTIRPYKTRPNPAWEKAYNSSYLAFNCVPREGFKIWVGRAATKQEFNEIVKKYGLTDDDISKPFEDQKGGLYGLDIKYQSIQVRVPADEAIPLESDLLDKGIEAFNGRPGRVNIRISPDMMQ